jgi:signal transduction histidine kinase
MIDRNFRAWIAFACCACLVLGAMLWLTRGVIATERERAGAEIRADLQERVRLSLWKMDSLGASLLLAENSIPPNLFLAENKTPLPAVVRFETPDAAAICGTGDKDALAKVGELLPKLISDLKAAPEEKVKEKQEKKPVDQTSYLPGKLRSVPEAQDDLNKAEWGSRERYLEQAISNSKAQTPQPQAMEKLADSDSAIPTPSDLEIPNPTGDFKASWFDGSLFLIRRGMTLKSFAQGTLVDDAALRELLLAEARPLLPDSSLVPSGNGGDDSFNLASFPFNLRPGNFGAAPESIPKTISATLLAGWLAAAVALLAAYFLIANVMKLSERRASFVSAVTHELRTPLTTFRLYSDMLSSGAVREEKRPVYLNVLSREADRLSHLVENVLAFSKIERGSARSAVADVELNALLASFSERFATRLEAAGLRLDLIATDPIQVKLDASALEHILFNLIDNAAKYAASSDPPVVTIQSAVRKGSVEIRVTDHGPGIPDTERRRIFRPFHKSAKQAAETKPGVGLGLALSKRLASSMGGALTCSRRTDGGSGAEFILSLPLV